MIHRKINFIVFGSLLLCSSALLSQELEKDYFRKLFSVSTRIEAIEQEIEKLNVEKIAETIAKKKRPSYLYIAIPLARITDGPGTSTTFNPSFDVIIHTNECVAPEPLDTNMRRSFLANSFALRFNLLVDYFHNKKIADDFNKNQHFARLSFGLTKKQWKTIPLGTKLIMKNSLTKASDFEPVENTIDDVLEPPDRH